MTRKKSPETPGEAFAVRPLGRRELSELVGGKLERGDADHTCGTPNDGSPTICVCSSHAWDPAYCGDGGG